MSEKQGSNRNSRTSSSSSSSGEEIGAHEIAPVEQGDSNLLAMSKIDDGKSGEQEDNDQLPLELDGSGLSPAVGRRRRVPTLRQSFRIQRTRLSRFLRRHHVIDKRQHFLTSNWQVQLIKNGRLCDVEELFETGIDVDARCSMTRNGETGLMVALSSNNHKVVDFLIEKGANLHATDKAGRTVLMYAAEGSCAATLKHLFSLGEGAKKLDAKCKMGMTALMYAASAGKRENVEVLLRKGANLEATDYQGRTALATACFEGHVELVVYLISQGADPNGALAKGAITPLMMASRGGHLEIIDLLIEAEVNFKATDSSGMTAAMHAVCAGKLGAIQKLHEKGCANKLDNKEVDLSAMTCLMHAANEGSEAVIKWLIEKVGVDDREATDRKQMTALMHASACGKSGAVQILLEKGGSSISAADSNGMTAFLHAANSGYVNVMEILFARDESAILASSDKAGKTALMLAAAEGQIGAIEWLLGKEVNIRASDKRGMTALMHAARKGKTRAASLLIVDAVDICEVDSNGMNALLHACCFPGVEIPLVELLLQHGADVIVADADGVTPLMHAIKSGNCRLVKRLIASGSRLAAVDANGKTIVMYAAEQGSTEILDVLINALRRNRVLDLPTKDRNGLTALMYAAKRGNVEAIDFLLEGGSHDKDAEDHQGMTASMHALAQGKDAVVALLHERGADIRAALRYAWENRQWRSFFQLSLGRIVPLTRSSRGRRLGKSDHLEASDIKKILASQTVERVNSIFERHNIDTNAPDDRDKTALMHALSVNKAVAIEAILEREGCDVGAKDMDGVSVLMFAAARCPDTAILQKILDKGALSLINEKCKRFGMTPLMYAAVNGHVGNAALLLVRGADVEARNGLKQNAMALAASEGHSAVVHILLSPLVELRTIDEICDDTLGRPALMCAAERGQKSVVELLIRKGADIKLVDKFKNTAANLAATNGHVDVEQLLLKAQRPK